MDTRLQTVFSAADSIAEEEIRLSAQRAELSALIARHCPVDGHFETAIDDLVLFRGSDTGTTNCGFASSLFGMMSQGAKRIQVGDEFYDYDARHYLISTVDLPIFSKLTKASVLEPYLGLAMRLDPVCVGELVAGLPENRPAEPVDRGIAVAAQTFAIQDAALRLVRLLDQPDDIAALAPLIRRELFYRLLTGPLGSRLRQAVSQGSHSHQIVRVIERLKTNLHETPSIDTLADHANMSKSSLHFHFKALTGMTPLQYQKHLRLQEARRLMITSDADAASAAHRVGYGSPSQFSREYRRLFGAPPARDVARLREGESEPASV